MGGVARVEFLLIGHQLVLLSAVYLDCWILTTTLWESCYCHVLQRRLSIGCPGSWFSAGKALGPVLPGCRVVAPGD